MAQYGENGKELILELKRSLQQNQKPQGDDPVTIPAYNDRLVRSCLQDLQLHVQALQDQVEANAENDQMKLPHSVRPSVLLQKAAIGRNKRCLLAYHHTRLSLISRAYWESQDLLSDTQRSSNLAPAEQAFAASYDQMIQKYVNNVGLPDCDLRASRHPPLPVDKVQVRVLESSQGPIVLESGQTVDLSVGAVHFLLFSDVESMLREGTVELLTAEEDGPMASQGNV